MMLIDSWETRFPKSLIASLVVVLLDFLVGFVGIAVHAHFPNRALGIALFFACLALAGVAFVFLAVFFYRAVTGAYNGMSKTTWARQRW